MPAKKKTIPLTPAQKLLLKGAQHPIEDYLKGKPTELQCSPNATIQGQIEELGKAIYVAGALLGKLESKLEPVKCVTPRPADEEKKLNEQSPMFTALVYITARVNDLCRRLSWLEEDIEL